MTPKLHPDFHISLFYKDGKPCMLIESKNMDLLEALHKLILGWLQ